MRDVARRISPITVALGTHLVTKAGKMYFVAASGHMHATAQSENCPLGTAGVELFLYSEVITSPFPKQRDARK